MVVEALHDSKAKGQTMIATAIGKHSTDTAAR